MNTQNHPIEVLQTGPSDSTQALILAHGAGAPMDSDFMNGMADRLSAAGIRCIRFEFPYMVSRRLDGKKKPPDRQPVLLDHYAQAIAQVAADLDGVDIYIGGKSMGGRIATLLAAEMKTAPVFKGVVCLGYPFHPPGRPEKTRTEHFPGIACPVLVCQGDRDPFGTRAEIESYDLPTHVHLHWLTDGNHDLAPRVRSGITTDENLTSAVAAITEFFSSLDLR